MPGRIHIGTSGWSYDHWRELFYPADLDPAQRLDHYARQFASVEINHSFYKLPEPALLRDWCARVPDHFVFSLKASRYITHMKKLRDTHDSVATLLRRARVLGAKLGPVIFQLPPRWKLNRQRLADFFEDLDKDLRYSFEFRDRSWIDPEIDALLRDHGAAFCIYELDGYQSPKTVTADFVYIRLHGPDGPYAGDYSQERLSGWAGAIAAWLEQDKDVYCYFDNDQAGHAVANAMALQGMLKHYY